MPEIKYGFCRFVNLCLDYPDKCEKCEEKRRKGYPLSHFFEENKNGNK